MKRRSTDKAAFNPSLLKHHDLCDQKLYHFRPPWRGRLASWRSTPSSWCLSMTNTRFSILLNTCIMKNRSTVCSNPHLCRQTILPVRSTEWTQAWPAWTTRTVEGQVEAAHISRLKQLSWQVILALSLSWRQCCLALQGSLTSQTPSRRQGEYQSHFPMSPLILCVWPSPWFQSQFMEPAWPACWSRRGPGENLFQEFVCWSDDWFSGFCLPPSISSS